MSEDHGDHDDTTTGDQTVDPQTGEKLPSDDAEQPDPGDADEPVDGQADDDDD